MLSGLLPSARFDADHDTFRETVRRFVDKAVLPHIDAWEEAETFPRALYR
ncbi:acyl-CoA dehydrogenase family protein, partial [Providencia stuartii]